MKREQVSPGIFRITLKHRENGKQAIVYEVLVDGAKVDGKRKRVRTRCKEGDRNQPLKTYKMAVAERSRLLNEIATGTHVMRRRTTVDQVCEDWLKAKHGLKPSSSHGYGTWFKWLRQELGDIEIQQLTKAHLDGLIRRLQAGEVEGQRKKWKPATVNKMLGRFNKVIDDARKQGLVYKNVVELLDRLPQEKAVFDILSEDEMFKILSAGNEDRHIWALSLYGLRAAEVVGLRWEYVDFEKRTISIAKTRVTAGKHTWEGTPKTQASRRTLPMPDEVYELLKEAYGRVESEYVVCNKLGEPITTNALSSRWNHVLIRLNIPHVRLHDARHSCASLMFARGVDDAIVSKWLGHASVAVTRAIYIKARPEALALAAAVSPRAGTLEGTQSPSEHSKIA